MKVHTNISGSRCVVVLRDGFDPPYVDARVDRRYPGFSFLEMVASGQVASWECVPDHRAPDRIIELMRKHGAHFTQGPLRNAFPIST